MKTSRHRRIPGIFFFSRKKTLTLTYPLIFIRRTGSFQKTSTCTSRSDPTLSARCDGSQLLLGILHMDVEVTNRGTTHGSIIPCVVSGLIPPVLYIPHRYVRQGYPPIGFLKYRLKKHIYLCQHPGNHTPIPKPPAANDGAKGDPAPGKLSEIDLSFIRDIDLHIFTDTPGLV